MNPTACIKTNSEPKTMTHRLRTVLMLSYISIASASAAIITPALPALAQTFKLGHGALEWVVSLFLLGYVLGQLPYGPLANRLGRLPALRAGLILNIIGILICIAAAYSLNYPLLLLGRTVTALGAASGLSCTFMLINESLPQEQAKRALSFAIVSFTLGIGLAVTIGGILTQYFSWKDCFWVLLAHGCLMLYLTRYLKESLTTPLNISISKTLGGLISAIRSKKLRAFSLLVGFSSAFAYCYAASAPLFAQHTLHLNAAHYGYWNLLNMVGMLGSGFLGAFLMQHRGPKYVLNFSMLCLLPVFALILWIAVSKSTNTLLFFSTSALFYLVSGLLFPGASYFASRALDDKANASSAMSFINMGSAMLSVIALGYLPFASITALLVVLIVFFALAVLLVSPYLWRQDPHTTSQ
jgi:MFS transporter, DHA1 family, multidrug resistance protein